MARRSAFHHAPDGDDREETGGEPGPGETFGSYGEWAEPRGQAASAYRRPAEHAGAGMGSILTGGGDDEAGSVLAQQWHGVRRQLRTDLGDAAFDSWLRPLDVVSQDGSRVILSVPTKFMREWVEKNYAERLRAAWRDANPGVDTVTFVLNGCALPPAGADQRFASGWPARGAAGACATDASRAPSSVGGRPAYGATPAYARAPQEDPVRAGGGYHGAQSEELSGREGLEEKYTFEQFVVGKSNELANAAARRVAESDTSVPFNPLFLHGGTGLGKTHLMHAIAWEIRRRDPSRKVLCLSAEKFMYRFVAAIRHHNQLAFKDQFRNVDVLMIDDFQFLSGKTTTQEEFFHTFNTLVDRNRQVVISADRSPSDLENIEERIRSRLSWGLVADIHPTDYELRLSILQSKARQASEIYGDVAVPQPVLDFLAHKITSNVRELEGALHRILAHAALVGRAITVDVAQEVLRPLIRANARKVTVEEIQRRVADYFDIKHQDMHSPRRARVVARPRQIAMYLSKQLTTRSLPDIGRRFGGRDHTTVMHAVRTIEKLRRTDPLIDESVENLRRLLEG